MKHTLNSRIKGMVCLKCGQTYCLEDYQIPIVELPSGFEMEEAEYVIKGVCPHCKNT